MFVYVKFYFNRGSWFVRLIDGGALVHGVCSVKLDSHNVGQRLPKANDIRFPHCRWLWAQSIPVRATRNTSSRARICVRATHVCMRVTRACICACALRARSVTPDDFSPSSRRAKSQTLAAQRNIVVDFVPSVCYTAPVRGNHATTKP